MHSPGLQVRSNSLSFPSALEVGIQRNSSFNSSQQKSESQLFLWIWDIVSARVLVREDIAVSQSPLQVLKQH